MSTLIDILTAEPLTPQEQAALAHLRTVLATMRAQPLGSWDSLEDMRCQRDAKNGPKPKRK